MLSSYSSEEICVPEMYLYVSRGACKMYLCDMEKLTLVEAKNKCSLLECQFKVSVYKRTFV